jgi:predicted nucleic acid-binding protein
LLFEYRDVIARPEIFRRARLDYEERALLVRAFVSCCSWQDIHFTWRPNLPDEADNHVMELAIAANATMLVTLNVRDFTRQELNFRHIEIVRLEQVIERLNR